LTQRKGQVKSKSETPPVIITTTQGITAEVKENEIIIFHEAKQEEE
jgi:hypothetical protein